MRLVEQILHALRATLKLKTQLGFDKTDGIFVKSLDMALASFNVEHQAYHVGSFVGNHVHTTLKVHILL